MDNTMCGGGDDTLHVFSRQSVFDYPVAERAILCAEVFYGMFQIIFSNLPHLPFNIREMVVESLDREHTTRNTGHPAVFDDRVCADSVYVDDFQPCAVTVENMYDCHIQSFPHSAVRRLLWCWHVGIEQ